MAKVYCDLNLRPRVDGKPTLIEAGESFDESIMDAQSLAELRRQGYIHDEGEFELVEEATVEEVPEEEATVEEVPEEVEEVPEEVVVEDKEKKPAPEGIWNFKRSDIEEMSLDILNAMYKKVASENGINVRAYSDKEKLLDKMCSEAAEA